MSEIKNYDKKVIYVKFRNKLFIATVILIIIPIALAIGSVYFIINYQMWKISNKYNIDITTEESIANPMIIYNWSTSESYERLQEISKNDPRKFQNKEFLDELNKEMEKEKSYLVVKIGKEFTYKGGNKDDFEKIKEQLEQRLDNKTDSDKNINNNDDDDSDNANTGYIFDKDNKHSFLVKQEDFIIDKQHKGSAVIVTDTSKMLPEVRSLVVMVVGVFVFVVLVTTVVLILWLYKGILRPLKELSSATRRISGGDLDFTIDYKNNDELGMLCTDFEYMRIQLKELIENQELYEKESRELVSNISHDLKTPLTAIKGYAEGLIDGVASTKEKQNKYLKTIYNKANAMTALVEELSLYSKVEGNMIMYEFIPINIDRYFKDCIEEMLLDVEEYGITLKYINNCDKDINVVIDGEQVKRVFDNVVNNAIKYIEDKSIGKIDVILNELDNFVRVEIKDNGKGMSVEDMPLIFDRFYRTDSSRNSAQGGTGLGLSIAKKIIEDHGGKIYAESTQGVGTSIIFTLPKEVEEDTNNGLVDEGTNANKDNNANGISVNNKGQKKIKKKPKYSFKINTLGRKNKQS